MTIRFVKIGFSLDTSKKMRNLVCIKNLLLINVHTSTYCQLGFSSKIEMPQLGSARLGTFPARLGSSREISARAHHYYLTTIHLDDYSFC